MSAETVVLKNANANIGFSWNYANQQDTNIAQASSSFYSNCSFSKIYATASYADFVFTKDYTIPLLGAATLNLQDEIEDIYGNWLKATYIKLVYLQVLTTTEGCSIFASVPFVVNTTSIYKPSSGYSLRSNGLMVLMSPDTTGYEITFSNRNLVIANKSSIVASVRLILIGSREDKDKQTYISRQKLYYGGDPGLGLNENWNMAFGGFDLNVIRSFYHQ